MNKIYLIVLLLFTFQVSSQELEKVIVYYPNSETIKESYTVLKTDENIKHGEYKLFTKLSTIKETGFYDYGNKTGVWETNIYVNDARITKKFDFDNNQELNPEISVGVNYPQICKELMLEGTVNVIYKVNSDCSIDSIEIMNESHEEFEKEAIRIVNKLDVLQQKYSKVKCKEERVEKAITFNLD